MFRASSAHLQEDIVVYKQHMVPSLSIRVPGGLLDTQLEWELTVGGRLLVGRLKTPYQQQSWHVTVHRDKFLYNKTNQMHQFHKFILSWNSTCFAQFVCPSSAVYSLYTQQWYMSYRFVDSFRAGPGWNSVPSWFCSKAVCMTNTIAECRVNKLLMMDRGTVRNM